MPPNEKPPAAADAPDDVAALVDAPVLPPNEAPAVPPNEKPPAVGALVLGVADEPKLPAALLSGAEAEPPNPNDDAGLPFSEDTLAAAAPGVCELKPVDPKPRLAPAPVPAPADEEPPNENPLDCLSLLLAAPDPAVAETVAGLAAAPDPKLRPPAAPASFLDPPAALGAPNAGTGGFLLSAPALLEPDDDEAAALLLDAAVLPKGAGVVCGAGVGAGGFGRTMLTAAGLVLKMRSSGLIVAAALCILYAFLASWNPISNPPPLPLLRFPAGDIQLPIPPRLVRFCGGAPSLRWGEAACGRFSIDDGAGDSGKICELEIDIGWSFSLS